MSRRRGVLPSDGRKGKLTREQVLAIRKGCGDAKHLTKWAEELGMTYNGVYSVYVGLTYAWVVERKQDKKPLVIGPKRYTTLGRLK